MSFLALPVLVVVSLAYAAVGHGGASGYLAILLLFGFAPEELRPLVLAMNVVVTLYILARTRRQDWSNLHFLLLLVIFSVPAAFLGGIIKIEDHWYRAVLGVLLLLSALRLLVPTSVEDSRLVRPGLLPISIVGSILGFISGFTGIGGGVLLSPLLVIFRWTSIKQSIPIVAVFILLNSIAGLAGWISGGNALVQVAPVFFIACLLVAFIGSVVGTYWSRSIASAKMLRYVLALVLFIAASKMIGLAF